MHGQDGRFAGRQAVLHPLPGGLAEGGHRQARAPADRRMPRRRRRFRKIWECGTVPRRAVSSVRRTESGGRSVRPSCGHRFSRGRTGVARAVPGDPATKMFRACGIAGRNNAGRGRAFGGKMVYMLLPRMCKRYLIEYLTQCVSRWLGREMKEVVLSPGAGRPAKSEGH